MDSVGEGEGEGGEIWENSIKKKKKEKRNSLKNLLFLGPETAWSLTTEATLGHKVTFLTFQPSLIYKSKNE